MQRYDVQSIELCVLLVVLTWFAHAKAEGDAAVRALRRAGDSSHTARPLRDGPARPPPHVQLQGKVRVRGVVTSLPPLQPRFSRLGC